MVGALALIASLNQDPLPGSMSGNALYHFCAAKQDSVDERLCLWYLTGYAFGHYVATTSNGNKPLYCPPKGATIGQMQLILLKWMAGNPAQLHEPAHNLIGASLINAFPCGQ